MRRELHVRFCEGGGVRLPSATRPIPLIPARRGGLPRDIANMALFLASDLSAYVNGETILVDGGLLAGGTPD